MRPAVRILIVFVLSAGCALALSVDFSPRLNAGLFGSKSPTPPGWMLRKQTVSLAKADFKAAERPCENWSWVAGITDMAESAGDIADLAERISHDYILDDGQKFRLAAQFTVGAPTQADPLIVAIRQNRPLMLFWRNHGYLLTGMIYDEYIAPTGNKMFMVNELKLFDPLGEEGKREQTFVRDRDNPDDLNGILELSVYPK